MNACSHTRDRERAGLGVVEHTCYNNTSTQETEQVLLLGVGDKPGLQIEMESFERAVAHCI